MPGVTSSIATIGYQAAHLDDLIATLKSEGVETLIDVRAAPVSKRPEFAKAALDSAITEAGLEYLHLGHLGSPPTARDAAGLGDVDLFERLFAEHLASTPAQAALDHAAALAQRQRICLMCLERNPEQCHRRFVATALSERTGLPVRHLAVTAPPGPLFGGG